MGVNKRLDSSKILAGSIFFGIGVFAVYASTSFPIGTVTSVGPGGIPLLLGVILACLGLANIASGVFGPAGAHGPVSLGKALYLIPLAALAFGLMIDDCGLVLSITVSVFIATIANPTIRWREVAILCVALSGFGVLIFVIALGLPFRIWPIWL